MNNATQQTALFVEIGFRSTTNENHYETSWKWGNSRRKQAREQSSVQLIRRNYLKPTSEANPKHNITTWVELPTARKADSKVAAAHLASSAAIAGARGKRAMLGSKLGLRNNRARSQSYACLLYKLTLFTSREACQLPFTGLANDKNTNLPHRLCGITHALQPLCIRRAVQSTLLLYSISPVSAHQPELSPLSRAGYHRFHFPEI